MDSYSQWNTPPQHPVENAGASTPNPLPPSSSMAPYMNSIQSFPIQESSAAHTTTSHAAPLNHQRHYYSSSSSLPGQYDSDERPTKSPRHSYMGNSSTYQNFETPFAAALPSGSGDRGGIYYSPAAQTQPWAPPPNPSGNYAQALQPQPQHHALQAHHSALPPPGPQSIQHHQQQPPHIQQQQQHHLPPTHPPPQQSTSSYPYSADAYPSSTRDDPQSLTTYSWSPAGQ